MNGTNRALLSLTESIESLNDTIFKLGWAFFFILVVLAVLFWWFNITRKNDSGTIAFEFNPQKASDIFDSGNIDELLSYCERYYERYPNNVWINWYYAIGNFNKGGLDTAQEYFLAVLNLNPSWESDVEPYLRKIRETSTSDQTH